jgi:hypothetical protein
MNNIFQHKEFQKPNFFQRLFKMQPKLNSVIEINNLLAKKELKQISHSDIEEIVKKYNVNLHRKYLSELIKFYGDFLNECLNDEKISENEFEELSYLRNILILSEKQVNPVIEELTSSIYKSNYENKISVVKKLLNKNAVNIHFDNG